MVLSWYEYAGYERPRQQRRTQPSRPQLRLYITIVDRSHPMHLALDCPSLWSSDLGDLGVSHHVAQAGGTTEDDDDDVVVRGRESLGVLHLAEHTVLRYLRYDVGAREIGHHKEKSRGCRSPAGAAVS